MFSLFVDGFRLHGQGCPLRISVIAQSYDIWGLDDPNADGLKSNATALGQALRLQKILDAQLGEGKHTVAVANLNQFKIASDGAVTYEGFGIQHS